MTLTTSCTCQICLATDYLHFCHDQESSISSITVLLACRDVWRRRAVPLVCMQETEQGMMQPLSFEEPYIKHIGQDKKSYQWLKSHSWCDAAWTIWSLWGPIYSIHAVVGDTQALNVEVKKDRKVIFNRLLESDCKEKELTKRTEKKPRFVFSSCNKYSISSICFLAEPIPQSNFKTSVNNALPSRL